MIAVKDEDTSDEKSEIDGTRLITSDLKIPVCQGKVGKYKVQTVRDPGTSCVVVKRKFVGDRQLTGKNKINGTGARNKSQVTSGEDTRGYTLFEG